MTLDLMICVIIECVCVCCYACIGAHTHECNHGYVAQGDLRKSKPKTTARVPFVHGSGAIVQSLDWNT